MCPMNVQINGQSANLNEAYIKAAEILSAASQPLIAGLGTDIAGAKAAIKLAQETGGIVDHLASDGLIREMRMLSCAGGFVTTPGEARNRADLILVVGKTPLVREPDLIKRLFPTGETLPHPGTGQRSLILLSGRLESVPGNVSHTQIDSGNIGLETLLGSLSAYAKGRPVSASALGETVAASLKSTAKQLSEAKFAVIVYAPAELNEPEIYCIRDMVNDLNGANRASTIAIVGRDNINGVNEVCGWTSGYPLRTSFARGHAEHDPYMFETNRLLQEGETDALLWISSFTKTLPPSAGDNVPKIVLGVAGTQFTTPPDVFIEVGHPGEDHDAAIYHTDHASIVAVRAKGSGAAPMISAAEALTSIIDQINKNEGNRAS